MVSKESARGGEGPSSIVSKESDGAWRDNFLARGVDNVDGGMGTNIGDVVHAPCGNVVLESEPPQAAAARVMPVRVVQVGRGTERALSTQKQGGAAAGPDQGEAASLSDSPHGQTEAVTPQSSLDFDDLKAIQARV